MVRKLNAKAGSFGFTLVELMVATIVLGLVISTAILAASIFLNFWQDNHIVLKHAGVDYRYRSLFRDSLESMYDYYVTDRFSERKREYYPFFKGEKQSMEFITLSSVFRHGAAAAVRIRVEGNQREGDMRIIYEEAILSDFFIQHRDDPLNYTHQYVPFSRLDRVGFRYYALLETRFTPETMETEKVYEWTDHFSGKERKKIPYGIEMQIHSADTGDRRLFFPVRGGWDLKYAIFNPIFE